MAEHRLKGSPFLVVNSFVVPLIPRRASGPQKLNPLVHAAIVSGSLSVVGDALAQLFSGQGKLDKARSARMGGFGFCLYGPYQSVWYRALDRVFPLKTTQNFLTKVTLNQLLLAPVVLAGVFTWNLALQGQGDRAPAKIKQDLVPTMTTGWKFWIPASSINFWLIPVQHQVLYMSCCGIFWSAYLSYSSNTQIAGRDQKLSSTFGR
ncbi:hypothetical protein WJX73_005751 [Symbiochloris irregularis]|uniref:Uncharacterized protein n=1 Tax=Symbiochloris irregularis TaxID=706552 RepID=A0AAW1P8V8_9CHLO